jgi:hypothetical protein
MAGHFLITFDIRGSQRFSADCEPGASGIISQSEAALKLQISKRTLQEGSKVELRHAALREPQSKKHRA